MKPGEKLELHIEALSNDGCGIAHFDGMVVFVRGALPGERVLADITEVKKNFARAHAEHILASSAERQAPACSAFSFCGGCDLQMLEQKAQERLKAQSVRDVLSRIGGVELPLPEVELFAPFGYRNRVQWHHRGGRLTFFERGSHSASAEAKCLLLPEIFAEIKQYLEACRLPASLWHFTLQANEDNSALMAVFCADGKSYMPDEKTYSQLAAALCSRFPQICSVSLNLCESRHMIYGAETKLLAGEEYLRVRLCGKSFLLYPTAFLQVNFRACEALYNKVLEFAGLHGDEKVWDIYCGIGTISLLLAEKAKSVCGVEYSAAAIAAANANARLNAAANCRFICGRAENILPELAASNEAAELAVLDPPRSGCAPAVIEALLQTLPQRIIYVSCDPATLARDIKLLAGSYHPQKLHCVDVFPQTKHIETVCLLVRKV